MLRTTSLAYGAGDAVVVRVDESSIDGVLSALGGLAFTHSVDEDGVLDDTRVNDEDGILDTRIY